MRTPASGVLLGCLLVVAGCAATPAGGQDGRVQLLAQYPDPAHYAPSHSVER